MSKYDTGPDFECQKKRKTKREKRKADTKGERPKVKNE